MATWTPGVKEILLAHGCRFERPGKGDHEIWFSPLTQGRFPVDSKILSRHTANAVVKLVWKRATEAGRAPSGITGHKTAFRNTPNPNPNI
jgi:hypothetical protein